MVQNLTSLFSPHNHGFQRCVEGNGDRMQTLFTVSTFCMARALHTAGLCSYLKEMTPPQNQCQSSMQEVRCQSVGEKMPISGSVWLSSSNSYRGDLAQDKHPIYLADHSMSEVSSLTDGMKFSHCPRAEQFNGDKLTIFSALGNGKGIRYTKRHSSERSPLLIVCIG